MFCRNCQKKVETVSPPKKWYQRLGTILLLVLGFIWMSGIIIGIVQTYSQNHSIAECVAIFIIGLLPFGIYFLIARAIKRKLVSTMKTNKSNSKYIQKGSVLVKADGTDIKDDEIPYLMKLSYQNATDHYNNSPNPAFHRTLQEDNLTYNFVTKYGKISSQKTDAFEALNQKALEEQDLNRKITLLQMTIKSFEEAKQWHYKISKGGKIYFQDMWEHLHNSNNPCFSWVDSVKACLKQSIDQRDYIIPTILKTISKNRGILQKDIYPYLHKTSKNDIQRTLRELEENGQISRIKKGSTYQLFLK